MAEHGGRVWGSARELGVSPEHLLDFSANLNPLGIPEGVIAVLREQLSSVEWYPEPQGGQLKHLIAAAGGGGTGRAGGGTGENSAEGHDGSVMAVGDSVVGEAVSPAMAPLDATRVVVGNGACELIHLLCHVLYPRNALVPAPSFSEYERAVRACGGTVRHLPLSPEEGFQLPVERLRQELARHHYDLLFLANPNNPTGTLTSPEGMGDILEAATRHGTFVLVDESFLGFLPDWPRLTALHHLPAFGDHLMVLNSFTKLYCLPGLRLGCAVAPPPLVERMEAARDPWAVNTLAQLAGIQCLRETRYVQRTHVLIPEFRHRLASGLESLPGIQVFPSAANFLLCRLATGSVTRLAEQLAGRLILIRKCSSFPGLGDSYFRVAVRLPDENQTLVNALADVAEEQSPGGRPACPEEPSRVVEEA